MSKRWTHGTAFGGVTIDLDGDAQAMILVDGRCGYSTALRRARRMVKLLNAGEAAQPLVVVSKNRDGVPVYDR